MMFPNVNLVDVVKKADVSFTKIAEARLVDYVKGLKLKAHNARMKHLRLFQEAEQAKAAYEQMLAQLSEIEKGNWDSVEALELQDKGDSK